MSHKPANKEEEEEKMNEFMQKTGKVPGPAVGLPGEPEIAFTISICVMSNGQIRDVNGPQNIKPHAVIDILATAIKMMTLVIEQGKPEPSRIIVPQLVGMKPMG